MRKPLVILAVTGCAAAAAAPVAVAGAPARKPQKKSVGVYDNYFQAAKAPAGKLTVNRNSSVRFVWTDQTADIHDVELVKAPKGVARFSSDAASAGYEYTNRVLRKLTVPGVYRFICTFHESDGMTFTLTVRH